MVISYPACFFQEGGKYSVVFPDLNDLSTCGDSLNDAMAMAIDCLAGYLYSSQKSKEAVNKPSDLQAINLEQIASDLEADTNGAFVNLVSVNVDEYAKTHFEKSVKKTLSIPVWLNNLAIEQNINFSGVLQDALKAKLGIS